MIDADRSPSTAAQRLRDRWRGRWGRGDSWLSSHKRAELAHQLRLEAADHEPSDPACPICRLRVRSCRIWLGHLDLMVVGDAAEWPAPGLPYCTRHLRLLLDAPHGRGRLCELLPGLLDAAHGAVQSSSGTFGPVATPRGCPPCIQENEIEIQAVRAAAQLPPTTGLLPGLAQLDFCHEHTLRIAARMVGRLGPELRAIPDLHVLVSSHRRQLRHLISGDSPRRVKHGRELVAVCDADAPVPPYPGSVAARTPPLHRCTVCAAAAENTRSLLSETAERLIQSADQRHHCTSLSLCRAHLRDLINHSRGEDETDSPAVLAGVAQGQLTELAPVLGWLDSGFGHPHTIRRAVAELTASHACPACTTHVEGQRHALAALTAAGNIVAQPDGQPTPICLRHSAHIAPEHPARASLADELLRVATGLLRDLASSRPLTTTTDTGRIVSTTGASTAADDPAAHVPLIFALELLDGRIQLDTAGAADDMST